MRIPEDWFGFTITSAFSFRSDVRSIRSRKQIGKVPASNRTSRCRKEQALKTAYLMALNKSLDNIKDEQVKSGVKGLIEQTQKELDEMKAGKSSAVK